MLPYTQDMLPNMCRCVQSLKQYLKDYLTNSSVKHLMELLLQCKCLGDDIRNILELPREIEKKLSTIEATFS